MSTALGPVSQPPDVGFEVARPKSGFKLLRGKIFLPTWNQPKRSFRQKAPGSSPPVFRIPGGPWLPNNRNIISPGTSSC